MKKTRTLYLALLLLLSAGVCRAQTDNVYQHGAQFTFDDITFTVNAPYSVTFALIYKNHDKNWIDEYKWYYADTGKALETDAEYDAVQFDITDKYGHLRAIKEIFTEEEIAALKAEAEHFPPMGIFCAFDPEGNVREINILMKRFAPLTQVSPERYARFFKRLTERLHVVYDPESPKLQFVALKKYVYFEYGDSMPPDPLNRPDRPDRPDNPTPPRPGN